MRLLPVSLTIVCPWHILVITVCSHTCLYSGLQNVLYYNFNIKEILSDDSVL